MGFFYYLCWSILSALFVILSGLRCALVADDRDLNRRPAASRLLACLAVWPKLPCINPAKPSSEAVAVGVLVSGTGRFLLGERLHQFLTAQKQTMLIGTYNPRRLS